MARISRNEMRKRREKARTEGYSLLLVEATRDQDGEPFYVRLRRLSLQEKASVNGISEETQAIVWERTRTLAKAYESRKGVSSDQMVEVIRNDTSLQEAVDAVVWAAVIDPPVTMDLEESEKDENLWHVSDFAPADKWSIYMASLDSNSKEARSLKLFREESEADVGNLGTL